MIEEPGVSPALLYKQCTAGNDWRKYAVRLAGGRVGLFFYCLLCCGRRLFRVINYCLIICVLLWQIACLGFAN